MRLKLTILSIFALILTASVTQAGIIFSRSGSTPVVPEKRIPELISVLRTSPDAHQREDAVEELRSFHHEKHPEVAVTLSEILMNDPSTSVRVEAARSLGRLRPISQVGGQALEHALNKDSAMRVRLQARSSLLQYRWRGYRSSDEPLKNVEPRKETDPKTAPKPNVPPVISTEGAFEPPKLDPLVLPAEPVKKLEPGSLPNLPVITAPGSTSTNPTSSAPQPLPLGKPK